MLAFLTPFRCFASSAQRNSALPRVSVAMQAQHTDDGGRCWQDTQCFALEHMNVGE